MTAPGLQTSWHADGSHRTTNVGRRRPPHAVQRFAALDEEAPPTLAARMPPHQRAASVAGRAAAARG
eukprot:scaffold140_cov565-Prasinococcus_capsulatus_cf.AAC.38